MLGATALYPKESAVCHTSRRLRGGGRVGGPAEMIRLASQPTDGWSPAGELHGPPTPSPNSRRAGIEPAAWTL